MLKSLTFSLILIGILGCVTTSNTPTDHATNRKNGVRLVATEQISGIYVDVYFFDPTYLILESYPTHYEQEIATKRAQWSDYLHNHILYAFALKGGPATYSKILVLRGNPTITQSVSFYKVDVLSNADITELSSLIDGYDMNLVEVVDQIPVRGSLFEHMDTFQTPSGKQQVGNGVVFNGRYVRVTPYDDITQVMFPLIQTVVE